MSHAAKVREVYDLMHRNNVNIYDLELMGHIDTEAERLTVNADAAFDKMVEDGFDLVGDSNAIEHYYQATADYVAEELAKRALLDDGEEREYRVVIEATDGSEEYQYEVEADSRESAIQQAHESAVADGLSADALWSAKTVEVL